jgi:MFS transporter, SHS family, sialic acid transporter
MQIDAKTRGIDAGRWMALAAALLGWMFDGFEMGIFPMAGPNALDDLLRNEVTANPALKGEWFGVIMSIFLIGAATGGVIFGWLGDRVGRVRAMSLSICTYGIFTGLCAVAGAAWQLAVFRFIASLGMGGEWALGVTLVTELWPDRSRALLAGLIGAAANVGMLLVGLLSLVLVGVLSHVSELLLSAGISESTTKLLVHGDGWRLLMVAGSVPAMMSVFINLCVPESHKWEAERDKGGTAHWATRDLWGVLMGAFGAMSVVVMWSPLFVQFVGNFAGAETDTLALSRPIAFARLVGTGLGLLIALFGFMSPVMGYLRRAVGAGVLRPADRKIYIRRMLLAAALAGICLLGTWGSLQWAPKWAIALAMLLPAEHGPYFAKEYTQIALAAGAIVGTIAAALVGGWLGRRVTYFGLCLISLASLIYMYEGNNAYGAKLLASVFVAGGATAAFYGWFPLYLPELFPTNIRATSQGFSFNFGRVLSAVGSLQTATLTAYFAAGIPKDRVEIEAFPRAGATLAAIYILGAILIWFGPETKGAPLPE